MQRPMRGGGSPATAAVLLGLLLNATLGWWWADPLAGFVIVFYGVKEGWAALHH